VKNKKETPKVDLREHGSPPQHQGLKTVCGNYAWHGSLWKTETDGVGGQTEGEGELCCETGGLKSELMDHQRSLNLWPISKRGLNHKSTVLQKGVRIQREKSYQCQPRTNFETNGKKRRQTVLIEVRKWRKKKPRREGGKEHITKGGSKTREQKWKFAAGYGKFFSVKKKGWSVY